MKKFFKKNINNFKMIITNIYNNGTLFILLDH